MDDSIFTSIVKFCEATKVSLHLRCCVNSINNVITNNAGWYSLVIGMTFDHTNIVRMKLEIKYRIVYTQQSTTHSQTHKEKQHHSIQDATTARRNNNTRRLNRYRCTRGGRGRGYCTNGIRNKIQHNKNQNTGCDNWRTQTRKAT